VNDRLHGNESALDQMEQALSLYPMRHWKKLLQAQAGRLCRCACDAEQMFRFYVLTLGFQEWSPPGVVCDCGKVCL
jgi:hypothetical protein